MARPRKLSDEEMLKIVDSFFESNGNPAMLKCSFLEEYAISVGFNVKAYDFRRNKAVRERMDELKDLSMLSSNIGAIAYKSLDVDAFLNRNRTKPMLRNSILELDSIWRRIYDRAVELSEKNDALMTKIEKTVLEHEKSTIDISDLSEQVTRLNKTNRDILIENRYLKKMVKTYLYPAVANEILKQDNVLEQIDTDVTQIAMDRMAEPPAPSSFSNSVASDREMLSQEEILLNRMKNQIFGGDNNA